MSIIDEVLHHMSYHWMRDELWWGNEIDRAYKLMFSPSKRGRAERRRQKARRYLKLLRVIQARWKTDMSDPEEVEWAENWTRSQISGSPWYHRRYDDSDRWKRFGSPSQRWPYRDKVKVQMRKFEQEFYSARKETGNESGDSGEHLLAQPTGKVGWRSQ